MSEHTIPPVAPPVACGAPPLAPPPLAGAGAALARLQLAGDARWFGDLWCGDAVGHPVHPPCAGGLAHLAGGGGLTAEVVT